jgi:hypothetical protein
LFFAAKAKDAERALSATDGEWLRQAEAHFDLPDSNGHV